MSNPVGSISPYIYGVNGFEIADLGFIRGQDVFTFFRLGGNRTSTYNWRNNASNAGADYHHMNDAYLGESNEPGETVVRFMREAQSRGGRAVLLTVPMLDYVAADKNAGADINETPNYRQSRLVPNVARRSETTDPRAVAQDEFVQFVEHARRDFPELEVGYSLDNEPGAWDDTHPRLFTGVGPSANEGAANVTYAEHLRRSEQYAGMLRDNAPSAKTFGPASFGFIGWMRLADAADAGNRDYLDLYLARLSERNLLSVVDVHFYSSVHVQFEQNGEPRWEAIPNTTRDDAFLLRMQVARSLYDPDYEEPSWIVGDFLHEPIELLPRLRRTLDAVDPNLELAITEYHYGGGADISGAVAQADVLGAYARYGVDYAAIWPLWGQAHTSLAAAVALFVGATSGFEGANIPRAPVSLRFGDQALSANSSNETSAGVWASAFENEPGVALVITRRDLSQSDEVVIQLDGAGLSEDSEVIAYGLTGESFEGAQEGQAPRLFAFESDIEARDGHTAITVRAPSPSVIFVRAF